MKNHKVLGSRVLAKRFEFPKQTDSGLFLPTHISNEKAAVGTTLELLKYQFRAEVINVGIECKHVKVGDIIVFGPQAYQPIPERPDDLKSFSDFVQGAVDSAFIMIDEYAIDYIEDKGERQ